MKNPSLLLSSDTYGMMNSALCIMHCLAMPMLIAIGASFLAHTAIELTFIALAAWSVRCAIGISTPAYIKIVLWTTWVIFGASLLLEEVHPVFEWMGLVGSAGLFAGHLLNLRSRTQVAKRERGIEQFGVPSRSGPAFKSA